MTEYEVRNICEDIIKGKCVERSPKDEFNEKKNGAAVGQPIPLKVFIRHWFLRLF